jgi:hypothetical protein
MFLTEHFRDNDLFIVRSFSNTTYANKRRNVWRKSCHSRRLTNLAMRLDDLCTNKFVRPGDKAALTSTRGAAARGSPRREI